MPYKPPASGGGGAVDSVNGRTGVVVLTAADVGAGQLPSGVLLPSGIVIPSSADISGILGTTSAKAAAGNDSRLSDARTPTAHKTSHATGGSDALGAGDLAPSVISGTAVVTADSRLSDARTPTTHATSHKSGGSDAVKLDELAAPTDITTLDATTSQHGLLPKLGGGTSNFLRADGAWSAIKTIPLGVYNTLSPILGATGATLQGGAVSTALTPTFHMLQAPAPQFTVSNLGMRIGTAAGGSTVGIAIYSIVWTGSGTFTATLVCQLNAAISSASGGIQQGAITTGAVGSGAGTYTLDFTTTQYLIGSMASTVTTLAPIGIAAYNNAGSLVLTAPSSGARSSVTDWPSTITDAAGAGSIHAGALGTTNRLNATQLINADGKNYL